MGIEELSGLEIVHGVSTLIFVALSILIGIRMITKYFSSEHFEHVTLGMSWIFLSSAWWGSAFSFLSVLSIGDPLPDLFFLFIGNFFLPFALISWIYSFTTILYSEKKKQLMVLILAICIPYEIFLITFLALDSSIIGTVKGVCDSSPNIIPTIFQAFGLAITSITGFIFSTQSMKVDNPKTKWRGRFLLLAFIFLIVGSLLDIFLPADAISLVIIRLILTISSIEYYLGFFLPDKLAERLIR